MYKISNIKVSVDNRLSKKLIAQKCKIVEGDIVSFRVIKKSVDARKKNNILYSYTVAASLKHGKKYEKLPNVSLYEEEKYEFTYEKTSLQSPLIVGAGPCGLFCALCLARAGTKPVLIERGSEVDTRVKEVESFWEKGELDKNSNVQFGEGGAGTFSDGKLTTGVNDMRMNFIKEQFVRFGAPEEIMYQSKPHIGTDKLRAVVKNIRNEIISLGGSVMFNTRLVDVGIEDGRIKKVFIQTDEGTEELECENLVLAIGHSARDTFEMLKSHGIDMERKTFSVGGRIEHFQKDIGYAQYGENYKKLPPADYKLAVKTSSGRGVYTFCMCPGGYVVASSSEEDGVVTNGMSNFLREGENANSALLVTVNPEDIPGDEVLGGMYLQREIEQKAFRAAGGDYSAPIQRVGAFLKHSQSKSEKKVVPTYRPGTKECDIDDILPQFIADSMREAIVLMDKKLSGFADENSVITVPETRSSSPVRILRDESFQTKIEGMYPVGEGAGYAGGIMSAAADGIKCAEHLLMNNSEN